MSTNYRLEVQVDAVPKDKIDGIVEIFQSEWHLDWHDTPETPSGVTHLSLYGEDSGYDMEEVCARIVRRIWAHLGEYRPVTTHITYVEQAPYDVLEFEEHDFGLFKESLAIGGYSMEAYANLLKSGEQDPLGPINSFSVIDDSPLEAPPSVAPPPILEEATAEKLGKVECTCGALADGAHFESVVLKRKQTVCHAITVEDGRLITREVVQQTPPTLDEAMFSCSACGREWPVPDFIKKQCS